MIGAVSTLVIVDRFDPPRPNYDRFIDLELKGRYENVYTVIPWSPTQARTNFYVLPPGTTVVSKEPDALDTSFGARTFALGTDSVGQDVLSQMMHACRLSISIGLVSTGISVLIGIVVGSLMGYFGGWVDLVLSRVVEIFMAIPVLFLLIVAAAVLPRNTYMMMAIIGLVSWTLSARFIRAEFLKMRSQDFVQGARAAGLPLRSVLFRHMLPNGITPVLVQASFAIAAAILAEATLSFLGLGPDGQASWGKLLASATGQTGTFNWWLAIFPGAAIFLTVLAYNLMSEAFRDAIDPKLRKAAH
jgi:peptide/nickel transport system permease protein